jgi:hypothetical protein
MARFGRGGVSRNRLPGAKENGSQLLFAFDGDGFNRAIFLRSLAASDELAGIGIDHLGLTYNLVQMKNGRTYLLTGAAANARILIYDNYHFSSSIMAAARRGNMIS